MAPLHAYTMCEMLSKTALCPNWRFLEQLGVGVVQWFVWGGASNHLQQPHKLRCTSSLSRFTIVKDALYVRSRHQTKARAFATVACFTLLCTRHADELSMADICLVAAYRSASPSKECMKRFDSHQDGSVSQQRSRRREMQQLQQICKTTPVEWRFFFLDGICGFTT